MLWKGNQKPFDNLFDDLLREELLYSNGFRVVVDFTDITDRKES